MNSLTKFRIWWGARSSSDRVYLSLFAVFLFFAAGYSFLYLPLENEHERALQRYARVQSDYLWAAQELAELEQTKLNLGGSLPIDAAPAKLKEMLESALEKATFKARLGVIRTDSGGQIRIEFKEVDGRKVMRFIEQIVGEGFSVLGFRLKNSVRGLSGHISVKV